MNQKCSSTKFSSPWSRWFFTACILFVLYLAYKLVEPYLIPIFLSVVLVVVAAPVYDFFCKIFGGRCTLASAVTCLLLTAVIALPFFFIAGIITSQALDMASVVGKMVSGDQLARTYHDSLDWLNPIVNEFHDTFGITQADILNQVGVMIKRVSNLLYENFTDLLKGVTNVIIGFALMLFVTFYLLMDGSRLVAKVISLSPLPNQTNEQVKTDMLLSLRGTLRGTVVLALLQGSVQGLGFWIFGVPNALFWGTVMVFVSVVPVVGTALVWAPAGIFLLATGHTGSGVGVLIWGLVVSVVSDNFIRPKLLGSQANLHPLLIFFSVLGGLSLFGIVGLILGPLVLAVLMSLLTVYEGHFLNGVEDPIETPAQTEEQTKE